MELFELKDDVYVDKVTVEVRRNGKGDYRCLWTVEKSDGTQAIFQKTYFKKSLGEVRTELSKMKDRCIAKGMLEDQYIVQNLYN